VGEFSDGALGAAFDGAGGGVQGVGGGAWVDRAGRYAVAALTLVRWLCTY